MVRGSKYRETVFARCLVSLMKHEAKVFDMISQKKSCELRALKRATVANLLRFTRKYGRPPRTSRNVINGVNSPVKHLFAGLGAVNESHLL